MTDDSTMIDIQVDGKTIQAKPGEMLIQAMDREGKYVPRFCYHKKLSIAANCRMCLVDVDKVPKSLPACATPVREGMVVRTRSEKAVEAQEAVMEFLLINHPLDCPICDQGGECELQDLALGYGHDETHFSERKRVVADENLGSLIDTNMTRCIHCTRCVRFLDELAGLHELGATNRGEDMRIGTYIEKSLVSELSGNVIDVCPVGALTSKPYRYRARAWELQQRPSIAPHDCIGSNINVHMRRSDQVMRVVPNENESVNEVWLADRDRFSYLGLNAPDRLVVPELKQENQWQQAEWQQVLEYIVKQLRHIIEEHGPEEIAVIASPNSTVEELYLLQKLFRQLGCQNVDHRLRIADTTDQDAEDLYPGLNQSIEELEQQDAVLLIGSNIRHEQPLAGLRLRKAYLQGANMMAINPIDFAFTFELAEKIITAPQSLVTELAQVAKALPETSAVHLPEAIKSLVQSAQPSEVAQHIAQQLQQGEKASIILGALAQQHPQAATIRLLARYIAAASGATYGAFTEGANTAGAWLAGMVPHRQAAGKAAAHPGLTAAESFAKPRKAYVLFNVEPELDSANPQQVQQALADAEFVVALNTFANTHLRQWADVLLPITPFTETEGTFINAAGQWQTFQPTALPREQAKPGWKIWRVLGNLFGLPGFEHTKAAQIREELEEKLTDTVVEQQSVEALSYEAPSASEIQRIAEWPVYRVDSLVRRAEALQESAAQLPLAVRLNTKLAEKLGLPHGQPVTVKQGQGEVTLPWVIDERIPDNCVYVPAGYPETTVLGDSFGAIEIHA